jgi:hypothetical protein
VFLDHDAAALLREHRKAQLKVRLKAGETWADNDLVFCQDDDQPWHRAQVSKRSKKLAAQAGVPVVTLASGVGDRRGTQRWDRNHLGDLRGE